MRLGSDIEPSPVQKGKPLVLHLREAEEDSLSILRNAPIQNHPIHVHCFTGTPAFAEALLKLSSSIYIGFTGIISFKNAENVRAAAKIVPLERLLLETDAPYLTPTPHRGQRNEPKHIPVIADFIASKIQTDVKTIAQQTTMNAKALFTI
mgnify:CR=1 FL=1